MRAGMIVFLLLYLLILLPVILDWFVKDGCWLRAAGC
jgi:hypothetical protein